MALSDKAAERKATPIATGVIDYFPLTITALARLSYVGNEQHNPGTPIHWDRSKSGDESDAAMRHFLERGTIDTDGIPHSVKFAWRAMALAEKELEQAAQPPVFGFDADGKWNPRFPGKPPMMEILRDETDERAGSLEDAPYSRTTRSSIPFPHKEHRIHLGQFGRDF